MLVFVELGYTQLSTYAIRLKFHLESGRYTRSKITFNFGDIRRELLKEQNVENEDWNRNCTLKGSLNHLSLWTQMTRESSPITELVSSSVTCFPNATDRFKSGVVSFRICRMLFHCHLVQIFDMAIPSKAN